MSIISFKNVSKSFGPLSVLNQLDLEFEAGQTTVVLGPSGTGKSVLLKHIVGLLRPDEGEIWFDGQRVDQFKESQLVEIRKQIGFLFQLGALFDSMNVINNVCFPLVEHTDLKRQERDDRAQDVLAMVGLPSVAEKMPAQLSGGQKKRVALARAMVLRPRVVLYDEPTTGLDPMTSDIINELIRTLASKLGITSLVVTHDMASAMRIADRMVMIYEGRVIADGTPEEFANLDQPFVKRFVNGEAYEEDLSLIRQGFQTQQIKPDLEVVPETQEVAGV